MGGWKFRLGAMSIPGFAVLLALACGSSSQTSSGTTPAESPSFQVASCPTASSSDYVGLAVSWAMGYEDIPSLKADADLVALFFVLGGPQGGFVVRDSVVSSLSAVYPERNIFDLGIRDVPLRAFVEQIRQ